MWYELTPWIRVRVVVAFLAALASSTASGAEDWLTASERDFFRALGTDVVVGGKHIRQDASFSSLREIAGKAEQPLRQHIETIMKARGKMKVTPQDRAKFAAIQREAVAQLRGQLNVAIIMMLLGLEPWDAAVMVADSMLTKQGRIVDAWKLQAEWLERGLKAQAEADAALAGITGGLERRIGDRKAAPGSTLKLELENRRFKVIGKIGTGAFRQPVIQVVLHRNPTGGKLVGLSLASSVLVRAMGVENMNFEAAYQSGRLALAQELVASHPLLCTQLLPDVPAGKEIALNIGLPLWEIASLTRVELKVWSADGRLVVDEMAGLDDIRREAIALARKEREERLARARAEALKRERRLQNDQIFAQIDSQIGAGLKNAVNESQRQEAARQRQVRDLLNNGSLIPRP